MTRGRTTDDTLIQLIQRLHGTMSVSNISFTSPSHQFQLLLSTDMIWRIRRRILLLRRRRLTRHLFCPRYNGEKEGMLTILFSFFSAWNDQLVFSLSNLMTILPGRLVLDGRCDWFSHCFLAPKDMQNNKLEHVQKVERFCVVHVQGFVLENFLQHYNHDCHDDYRHDNFLFSRKLLVIGTTINNTQRTSLRLLDFIFLFFSLLQPTLNPRLEPR